MRDGSLEAPPQSVLPWRALAVAATLGLALRLAFGLVYWTDKPLTRDEREYLSLARSLAAGRGFTYDDDARAGGIEPFGRAPGYPAFLVIAGGGAPSSSSVPTTVKVAQALVGAAGVLMVGLLAHRIAGRRAAAIAAVIAAAYPPLVWVSGYALSEALFWPIGLLAAWMFDRATSHSNRLGFGWATGLLVGVGVLIRPGLVLALPIAGLVLLARRQMRLGLAMMVGVVLVVTPWTVRNYREHGRLVFVASEGGVTFWTGNHPLAIGDGDLAANLPIKLDDQRFRAAHPGLSEEELEPLYYREALAWITSHPADWLGLELRKLFYLIVPIGPSYTLHSTRYYVLSIASYVPLLVLASFGVWRRGWPGRTPGLMVLAASAVVGALIFFPQERFRIPILDPMLVILAAMGLTAVGRSRPR